MGKFSYLFSSFAETDPQSCDHISEYKQLPISKPVAADGDGPIRACSQSPPRYNSQTPTAEQQKNERTNRISPKQIGVVQVLPSPRKNTERPKEQGNATPRRSPIPQNVPTASGNNSISDGIRPLSVTPPPKPSKNVAESDPLDRSSVQLGSDIVAVSHLLPQTPPTCEAVSVDIVSPDRTISNAPMDKASHTGKCQVVSGYGMGPEVNSLEFQNDTTLEVWITEAHSPSNLFIQPVSEAIDDLMTDME